MLDPTLYMVLGRRCKDELVVNLYRGRASLLIHSISTILSRSCTIISTSIPETSNCLRDKFSDCQLGHTESFGGIGNIYRPLQ